jgi:hypothetical protein
MAPPSIGYGWLIDRYGLTVTQPRRIETVTGPTRNSVSDGFTERRTVPEVLRPDSTLAGHLTFALKHEGVHLELLSRLFSTLDPQELEAWVRSEPTGQYARRSGYFYEWFTGRTLDVPDLTRGNYVNALDPERELVAPAPSSNSRWRIRDNLLGVRNFCPQIQRTAELDRALELDVRARIERLEGEFSAELVLRSAVWLTIKESRASFAIEHEQNQLDRIQRFAAVIEQRTGTSPDPLDLTELESLQREILGPNALHYGVRLSPVFVGESDRFGQEVVHYIGPHWDDVPPMLAGLREVLTRTRGLSPVARAGLLSFGFVYLHPMVDGNGRISRFLINDVLRRDGAVPAPYIVPVSASLQRSDLRPLNYDGALELFSRPFMQHYRSAWSFGDSVRGADGVTYNLRFERYADANHAWRYPDLTRQVSFLSSALEDTIAREMHAEALYLQQHGRARARLKTIIEGPDSTLDRIIRSIRQSRGTISGKLRAEYPLLEREEIGQDVISAIREEFPW